MPSNLATSYQLTHLQLGLLAIACELQRLLQLALVICRDLPLLVAQILGLDRGLNLG